MIRLAIKAYSDQAVIVEDRTMNNLLRPARRNPQKDFKTKKGANKSPPLYKK
jgi:hypothetical protein